MQPDGKFSNPRNLGPCVNTAAPEFHPTVLWDRDELYFVRVNETTDFYSRPAAVAGAEVTGFRSVDRFRSIDPMLPSPPLPVRREGFCRARLSKMIPGKKKAGIAGLFHFQSLQRTIRRASRGGRPRHPARDAASDRRARDAAAPRRLAVRTMPALRTLPPACRC